MGAPTERACLRPAWRDAGVSNRFANHYYIAYSRLRGNGDPTYQTQSADNS
jgi:hypothetical protein